jgi:uroporphyrin-3 C-methyltransferase
MPVTDSNAQLPATVEDTSRAPRPRTWPIWLVLLLTLALTVLLALWSWQQWQTRENLAGTVSDLRADVRMLQENASQRDNSLTRQLQSLQQTLADQRERIATQQRQIDQNASELLEAGNRSRTDWLLAEAEYLLRIANQRLQIEKDIRGALAALTEADRVLRQTDDVGSYPVRQQVAKEAMTLRSLESVDRTGLYLKLQAAIDSVNQLTDRALAGNQAFDSDASPEAGPEPMNQPWWQTAWEKISNTLSRVVVVRRMDEPVKPLLSPEQSAYTRLNLQLTLEEAALAVLRGQQALYDRALAKARSTIDQWYDNSLPRVNALKQTLNELAGLDIDPALPDISESLQLLKARLEGRLSSPEAKSGNTTGRSSDS